MYESHKAREQPEDPAEIGRGPEMNIEKPHDLEVIGCGIETEPNTVEMDIDHFARGYRRERLEH